MALLGAFTYAFLLQQTEVTPSDNSIRPFVTAGLSYVDQLKVSVILMMILCRLSYFGKKWNTHQLRT
ncbi:hypothetical protein O9929_16810 [Vibrio lentus]|nr:hypothetical protein [Vibrio lentus]